MNSSTLIYPAVWFMRRMRLNVKMGLMSALLLLPLMWMGTQQVLDRTDQINFTRSELHGSQLILQLSQLDNLVQRHRGRTALLLSGDAAAQERLNVLRTELKTVSRAVLALSEARADFGLSKEWGTLAQRIDSLQETSRLSAPESFKLHTALVADLHRFKYTVAERSQLLFEPEPGPYFLMDLVVSRVPPVAELVAQLRGQGAAQLSQAQVQADAVVAIQLKASRLEAMLGDLRFNMSFVDKHLSVDPSAAAALQVMTDFLQTARSAFAQPGSVSVEAYFSAGTGAIEAISRYQAKEASRLETRLKQRVESLQLMRLVDVGSITAGTLLLLYFMSGFYVGFMSDLRQIMKAMRDAANGSLKSVLKRRGADELAELTSLLQVLINNTSVMVCNIRSNSALVAHAGKRLAEGNQELADRTEQQAASLEQTAASVQQLTSTVAQNAQTASESDTQAAKVRDVAENGATAMDKAVITVEGIQRHAQKMNEIIDVIDKLAFQTNILALNAAVEAARAGEQGRGFAVVASEVRSLAQRSAASAREIRELILTSRTQVEQGTTQIRQAGQSIAQIVHGVRGVASNMSLISASSAEQSSGLSEISSAVMQLDSITQSNAQMVERAVVQAVLLEKRAERLSLAVASFQLQQGSADEARELVKRAEALFNSAGRESFLKRITDHAEGFHDRDMYVFVLDAAGTYRAFGGKPEKVGTRVQDIAGVDGAGLLRAIVVQADMGSGWVQYNIANPVSGQVQEKMSYVCKVGELYLGCGVYVSVEVEQAA